METTSPDPTPLARKLRTLAFGALATVALSLPAVSTAAAVAGHDAARGIPVRISPDSHRLALSVVSHSIRLT